MSGRAEGGREGGRHAGAGHADGGRKGDRHADAGHADGGRKGDRHADAGHADGGRKGDRHADAGHAEGGRPAEEGGLHGHRRAAPAAVPTAVLTVSDTRTLETDVGGALVAELLAGAGHPLVSRAIVRDEPDAIRAAALAALAAPEARALIVTGGTGVAPRDVTPDALEPLLERVVPGFGELFRALSYAEIGSAALLSRALAGLRGGRVVFVLPGSRGAVRLAMEKLILPELGHLAGEAAKTR